jgi:hypothetical protein
LLQKTYSIALFGIDARNAGSFAQAFEEASRELSALGDGSELFLAANPINKWEISAEGKAVEVLVVSDSLGKTKMFSAWLAMEASFPKTGLFEKTRLRLSRENGKLIVNR